MKKIITAIILVSMLAAALTGCSGSSASGSASPSWNREFTPGDTVIACCMGSLNHPVHRIVQMAFMTKAQELGYQGIVAGLDEGSNQELITKFEGTITNGAEGCLIWAVDDGMYTMMRDLSNQCVFVVPHFAHNYQDTKDFISRNICCLPAAYGKAAADYIVEKLAERGITSGVLGITQAGANVTENAANDAFRAEIAALGSGFTVADTVFEGVEVASAAVKVTGLITAHPDMVGGFGTTGGSCQSWNMAMANTGRTDLVVIGTDYTEINQDLVLNGTIAAVVAQPLYDEGQNCVVSLDAIFRGTDFAASEEDWLLELDGPIAYVGGEGGHDISSYRSVVEKAIAYFEG